MMNKRSVRSIALIVVTLTLFLFLPGVLAMDKPISVNVLGTKKISDVIRPDGTLTGLYASQDKSPEGESLASFSSYAELLSVLRGQNSLYAAASGGGQSGNVITAADAAVDIMPEGSFDFSTTNVRTKGIDEPDLIKTDGKYIYYLHSRGYTDQSVVIVEANTMQVAASIKPPAGHFFEEIFISGERLVVQSGYSTSEARVGRYRNFEAFLVYNISDKRLPELVRQVRITGSEAEARLLNGTIYVIASDGYYPLFAAYSDSLTRVLPLAYDSAVSNEFFVLPPQSIHYYPGKRARNYSTFAVFRVDDNEPADIQSQLGEENMLYMSARSLYLLNSDWIGKDSQTMISRYTLQGASLRNSGGVSIHGWVLNQYSIDEYNGYLRIATTSRDGNHLFVLDDSLRPVGEIKNLAKGESIQSVRFMGKAGYMVTYRQTDPLFALDLSVPAKPHVTGQLKIPGFSSYLHPFSAKYLVGIGRETAETFFLQNGKRVPLDEAVDLGLKISLFDVSRPTSPREVARKVIGGPYTRSNAAEDPRSIMVDESRSLMAFPIRYSDDDPYKDPVKNKVPEEWDGGIVLTIRPGGISIKAKMKQDDKIVQDSYSYYYDSSRDSRFCRIGDKLYYAADDLLRSYDYATFQQLAQVKLP